MIIKKTALLLKSVSFFLLFYCLIFFSCTKLDVEKSPGNTAAINYSQKFFDVPVGAPTFILQMVNKMKKLNDSTRFVNNFVKQNGFPAWNKFILPKTDFNLTNRENSFTAGDSLFIVPIIEENANFVSSFIISYTSNPEKFELIKGKHYIYYSREALQLDTINADKAALQIAWLNFKIFGYTKFFVNDTLLFQSQYGTKPGQRIIKLNGDSSLLAAGKVASVEVCITQPAEDGCSCGHGDISICTCTLANCCWVTDCTVTTFGGGEEMGNWNEGSTYTPPSGNGGNGGSTTFPDPFPCPILQGKEAPLPGCEEGGVPPVIPVEILENQLNQILEPGDSYSFTGGFNSGDEPPLAFISVGDFQSFKEDLIATMQFDLTSPHEILNQTQKAIHGKVKLNFIGGIDIRVELEKTNNLWKVNDVSSTEFGITLTWGWEQTGYIQNTIGNEVIVIVTGYLKYNFFIDGIGTVYKQYMRFQIKIDKTSGQMTSLTKL